MLKRKRTRKVTLLIKPFLAFDEHCAVLKLCGVTLVFPQNIYSMNLHHTAEVPNNNSIIQISVLLSFVQLIELLILIKLQFKKKLESYKLITHVSADFTLVHVMTTTSFSGSHNQKWLSALSEYCLQMHIFFHLPHISRKNSVTSCLHVIKKSFILLK